MAHVANWKKDEVKRLAKLLVETPTVAVAKIGGIPGPQIADMRASLRGKMEVIGAKNRLLRLAIAEAAKSRPGIEGLSAVVDGQSALVATDMNPFKLYKTLELGKQMAPLRGGSVAEKDVTVEKGPTAFGPGPIVGEFQKVGIPAKIEGGKVQISKTVTPVKAGDTVSQELAVMLAKLDIKPVELKINLLAAFEEDTVFGPEVLAVDETVIMGQVSLAVRTLYELSMLTAFPTKISVDGLVGKAFKSAVALALETGVDLADNQDMAAEAYAKILASVGVKPADLTPEMTARLGAHVEAMNVVAAAPVAANAAPVPEEEEEEAVSEEEAAAGLGDLFGF